MAQTRHGDDLVVVWGNCQAEPLALLLQAPLATVGLQVVVTPPVYLVDEAGLARVHELVSRAALLVSQPIGENYRWRGSSTSSLAARLLPYGRLLTIPVAFHVGGFPFQVHAHGGDGVRVLAPLTDYHDLRAIVAASQGLTPQQAVDWWPAPEPDTVRAVSQASIEELRRREAGLDVPVSHRIEGPDALWTMTHSTNRLLGEVATDILAALGVAESVVLPEREFLGERRAPLEAAVVRAQGWPSSTERPTWQIRGRDVSQLEVLAAQLSLYDRRRDIVADTLVRYRTRLTALGLSRAGFPPDEG